MAIRHEQSDWKLSYSAVKVELTHPNGTWKVSWSQMVKCLDCIDCLTGEIKWVYEKDIRDANTALVRILHHVGA